VRSVLADRYEIRGLLGKGGMAEVHDGLAHGAHGFCRRVAIKRLGADASDDPKLVRMFLDEARIASRMHHAGIVAVLDYGVADGRAFQVLELVEGWDTSFLAKRAAARNERVPLEVVLHVGIEVAHALAYAHESVDEEGRSLGVVHRDVKPSNIMISRGGDVKLGDFGIALARERSSRTTGLIARGTPGFMSPEQLFGGVVDGRSDVFALACTLHALLAGSSPMASEEARAAVLGGAELEISPDLPPELVEIMRRALRRNSLDRFATCREMATALGGVLAARLRTDPKTRVLEWLRALSEPVRPSASSAAVTTDMKGPSSRPPPRNSVTAPGLAHSEPPPPLTSSRTGVVFAMAVIAPLVAAALVGGGVMVGRRLGPRDVVRAPALSPTELTASPSTPRAPSPAAPPSMSLPAPPAGAEATVDAGADPAAGPVADAATPDASAATGADAGKRRPGTKAAGGKAHPPQVGQ